MKYVLIAHECSPCSYSQMYKKTTKSSEKKAVSYFNHFPSNFLKPYGKASTVPDEETIQRRINPVSCEWLLRPRIAMSEFSATVVENLTLLKNENFEFIKKTKFAAIFDSMQPFLDALTRLNTKSDETASEEDVNTVMTTIYDENNALDKAVDEMFVVGGAMYTTAIQYIVARSIMSEPNKYAEKLVGDDRSYKAFKKAKNVKALQRFLHEQCLDDHTTVQHTSTPSRSSLLQQLQAQHEPEIVEEQEQEVDEGHADEEEQSVSQKRKKGKKSQKKHKRQKVDDDE